MSKAVEAACFAATGQMYRCGHKVDQTENLAALTPGSWAVILTDNLLNAYHFFNMKLVL